MIELVITGGLGNQMFQYACARNIQLEKNEEKLLINTYLYRKDTYGRRYSLDSCNISNDVETVEYKAYGFKLVGGIANIAENIVYSIAKYFGVYMWKSRKYRNLDCVGDKVVLYGYFQSEKYFIHNADKIKKELKISKAISTTNCEWLNRIQNVNAVCLHIRRGDYLREGMVVCDKNYYLSAIDYMKEHVQNPVFFIFSDDMSWVKENYSDESFVFVDNNNPDYEELRLMYNCKHFILSNSSFSWWAQYLSDNDEKIVIAPSKWMPGDPFYDIYMDNWIII